MQEEQSHEYVDLEVDMEIEDSSILEASAAAKAKPAETKDAMSELLDKITLSSLYESNWHVGDKRSRRGQYMGTYVFEGTKNTQGNKKDHTDIIDLNKTVFLFKKALNAIRKCVARGEKILFVGTESHTSGPVKTHAERCAQYSISRRWLGGLLTNWHNTFSPYIIEMKRRENREENTQLTKREQLMISRKRDRFMKFLDSVKDMGTLPGMIVVTSNREKNAIKEAQILGIPVVLLMDTSSNPNKIAFPVPGNDRSIKVTEMFCQFVADACLYGLKDEMNRAALRQARADKNNPEATKDTSTTQAPQQA